MSAGESISALLGRSVLAWLYLALTYRYARDWDQTVILLSMKGVTNAQLPLLAAMVMNILGSLSLVLGFHTRAGAVALFLVTVSGTFVVYDFWNVQDSPARDATFEIFARNVGIAAGLILLVGMGPGRFALDNLAAGQKAIRQS
jgi:putative oxidoreductase